MKTDVVIVGAGPAGLTAASTLGRARPSWQILLIDENERVGGQLWRQRFSARPGLEADLPANISVRGRTSAIGWSDRGALLVRHAGSVDEIEARYHVVATGARERAVPLPGWTLPGVMTVGAAQALLKGSGSVPFRTVVIDGTGPLPLAAAAELAAADVRVAALVGGLGARTPLARVPALLRGGKALVQGAVAVATLAGRRVPVRPRGRLLRVLGETKVTGVEIEDHPGAAPRLFECDAVLLSHGFVSTNELVAGRGAAVELDSLGCGWIPHRDEHLQTSIPGLYAIGDCVGVAGGAVAAAEGELAALAIIRSDGGTVAPGRERSLRRRLASLHAFQQALSDQAANRPIAPDPHEVACRCEGTTVGQVNDALDHGVSSLAGLKLWTRAGMGPCQGRTCDHLMRSLCEQRGISVDQPIPVRFPVRPLALGEWGNAAHREERTHDDATDTGTGPDDARR